MARQWPHPSMHLVWSLTNEARAAKTQRGSAGVPSSLDHSLPEEGTFTPMARNVFLVVHSTVTRLFMSQPYYQMPQELKNYIFIIYILI